MVGCKEHEWQCARQVIFKQKEAASLKSPKGAVRRANDDRIDMGLGTYFGINLEDGKRIGLLNIEKQARYREGDEKGDVPAKECRQCVNVSKSKCCWAETGKSGGRETDLFFEFCFLRALERLLLQ